MDGLPHGYEHITQSTLQNNACFNNGGSKKGNPNPTKIPDPRKALPKSKTLTLPKS